MLYTCDFSAATPSTTPSTTHLPNAVATKQQAIAYEGILEGNLNNLKAGDILDFSQVITNEGNAYSNKTFTCPVKGIYLFGVTLLEDKSGDVLVALKRSGYDTPIVRPHTNTASDLVGTGEVGVVECQPQEKIHVTVVRDSTSEVNHFSRFTAVLLHQLL